MKQLLTICTAAAWLAVGGCGGSSNGPRPIPPPPDDGPPAALEVSAPVFYPGELMSWEMSWKGIQGGAARLLVGRPGSLDGRQAILVRSETRSEGLLAMFRHIRDDLITTIDLSSSRPIRSEGNFEWGKPGGAVRNSRIEVAYGDASFYLAYQRRGQPTRSWTQRLPTDTPVYDTHSVLGALRAWAPEPGTRAYFLAVSGRRLYHVEIAYAGTETIDSTLGSGTAIRIEGTATRLTRTLSPHGKRQPRQFTLWLSDDTYRLPLRVSARTEYGPVEVELVGYEQGDQPAVATTSSPSPGGW